MQSQPIRCVGGSTGASFYIGEATPFFAGSRVASCRALNAVVAATMTCIMALRLGPFAFFLNVIDDPEYGTLLTRILDTILSKSEIILTGGGQIGVGDPGGNFERWLPFFRSHMFDCQELHNSMLDIRPTGSLFRTHKRLISIVKSYSFAVADYADCCVAWASEDIDMDAAQLHERNGRTWDKIASGFAQKLEKKWQELEAPDRERLAAMIGSDEFPEQLERLANPSGEGFVWGL